MSKKLNAKETNATNGDAIPGDAIEALARMLYPAMAAYFESEGGKREFAEWQAQQKDKGGEKVALSAVVSFSTVFSFPLHFPFYHSCLLGTLSFFHSRPPEGWAYQAAYLPLDGVWGSSQQVGCVMTQPTCLPIRFRAWSFILMYRISQAGDVHMHIPLARLLGKPQSPSFTP